MFPNTSSAKRNPLENRHKYPAVVPWAGHKYTFPKLLHPSRDPNSFNCAYANEVILLFTQLEHLSLDLIWLYLGLY
jgi:hypothetical protein